MEQDNKEQKEKEDLSKKVIGLTFEEFKKQYPNVSYRVMQANGTNFMGTADLKLDRLNLHLEGVEELEPEKYVFDNKEYSVKKFGNYSKGIIKSCGWG